MKQSISYFFLLRGTGEQHLKIFLTFTVSLVLHAVLIASLIYVPVYTSYNKKLTHSIINVSMVTLPNQGAASMSAGQIEVKSKTQSSKQKKAQVPKIPSDAGIKKETSQSKQVSVAPKKVYKTKKSLKKKTFKSSRVIKSAIKKIEKQVEESRPTHLLEAINRLKSEVGSSEASDVVGMKAGMQTEQGGNMLGSSIGSGYQALKPIDIYKAEIPYHIEKNWAFSEQLAGGDSSLIAVVVIKIMQNGEIKDIWFEKKSGNSYFDESAFKAVKKSDPLPMLPKEYLKPYYNLGLIFTPSGLKKGMN